MGKRNLILNVPSETSWYLAISCADTIHKLTWNINTNLQLNLNEHTGISSKNTIFPVQFDESSSPLFSLAIIKNKVDNHVLIKELKNIDYILVISGSITAHEKESITTNLKGLSGITAVIPITTDKIKSLNLLAHL